MGGCNREGYPDLSHRRRKNKAEAVLCVQGGFAVFKVHRAKHTVFDDGF